MKPTTKEWITRAEEDLRVIEKIIDDVFLTNMVAFHSHQVVEKCFKAIIEEFEIGFIRMHNLETLYGKIKEKFKTNLNVNILKELNKVYIDTRYPTGIGYLPFGKPSQNKAKEFYDFAKKIYEKTKEVLK
jgi:HEPN domain-containing protein